jgi:hypothetical protein
MPYPPGDQHVAEDCRILNLLFFNHSVSNKRNIQTKQKTNSVVCSLPDLDLHYWPHVIFIDRLDLHYRPHVILVDRLHE